LFTEAIIKYASEDIKKDILPKLVSGECIGTLAITEDLLAPTENNISVSSSKNNITGKKIAVPDAGVATHVIAVCSGEAGIELRMTELNKSSIKIDSQENIDESRGHFSIEFNDAESVLIGDAGNGWELVQNILNQAAVLFSFEQIGGAQASLDMANTYAKEKLADMYIAITLAKSNSYYGAWALSTDSSELAVAAATARVSSTEAFQFCSKENIQTHGGNGFTWEYDCHLFYRRSKLLSLNIGSLATWKEKLICGLEKSNLVNSK
jgi:acyl-CoA dehydrogenase